MNIKLHKMSRQATAGLIRVRRAVRYLFAVIATRGDTAGYDRSDKFRRFERLPYINEARWIR